MADNKVGAEASAGRSRSSLRSPIVWGTVLSSLVALPALAARPWADERFLMYWPEKIAGARPWRIVTQVIDEIPGYLDTGVFRPLSRFFLYASHWVTVRIGIATGFPPNVVAGVVKVAVIGLLVTAVLLTLDQYRRAASLGRETFAWKAVVGATVVSFAASLVLWNPARHPLTLFPFLYLGTAGLTMLVPLSLGRLRLQERSGGNGRPRMSQPVALGVFALIGAAAASAIELAYLALPLAFAHLVLLEMGAGTGLRAAIRMVIRGPQSKLLIAMAAGFLAVFIPTRIAITVLCAETQCYRAAEPAIGLEFFSVLPGRLVSGLFPVTAGSQARLLLRSVTQAPEFLMVAVFGAVLAGVWLRRQLGPPDRGDESGPGRAFALPAVAYFCIVLVLASALAALSSRIQDDGLTISPWRETGFVWAAWSALLGIAGAWALVRARRVPSAFRVLTVLVALAVVPTTVVNYMDMERVRAQPESRIHNEIAVLIVNFEKTPDANRQRCRVQAALTDLAATASEERKARLLFEFLDVTAQNHYGRLFCDPDSS